MKLGINFRRNTMTIVIAFLVLILAMAIKFYIYDVSWLTLDSKTYEFYSHASIFNFQVDSMKGNKKISLSKYKGKQAYLIVNVASECQLSDKNYAELQEIYDRYRYLYLCIFLHIFAL